MSAQLRTNSALRVDVTVYKNRACIYECLRVMFAVPWHAAMRNHIERERHRLLFDTHKHR